MPLSELTASRWLRPTAFVPVPPALPIPCAQCGQAGDGLEEWQLLTVNTFEKSALPEPMTPDQMYFARDPLLRKESVLAPAIPQVVPGPVRGQPVLVRVKPPRTKAGAW